MAINNQEAEALFGSPVDVEQGFTEEPKQEESNVIPNELQYYFTNDVIAEEQGVFRKIILSQDHVVGLLSWLEPKLHVRGKHAVRFACHHVDRLDQRSGKRKVRGQSRCMMQ